MQNNLYISNNKMVSSSIKDMEKSLGILPEVTSGEIESPSHKVRPGYYRNHYEEFRPSESIPTTDRDIMVACRTAYEGVGLIKSVVDLMVEMAIEGLELRSEDPSTESFYKSWFDRVNLMDRAEKYATDLIVEGNVVVRRKMGEIDTPEVRRMRRSTIAIEKDIEPGNIPLEYVFYDPSMIELIGDELATFVGDRRYGIRISAKVFDKLGSLATSERNKIISNLPSEIRSLFEGGKNAVSSGTNVVIMIPKNRVYVSHYKKKDSAIWAKSIIYSVLREVIFNDKLRLAKESALDGWRNAVRLWKLGDHEQQIFPAAGSFNRLSDILKNNDGGIIDIIWDSMISYEDHYPPIDQLQNFDENYETILLALGIPRSLVGGSEKSTGTANMFTGLRNMMKKIEAVRRSLENWIKNEIDIITNNLGFRIKPKIYFAHNDLHDAQVYYKFITDMYDRGLVSDKTILEKVKEDSSIERSRIGSEEIIKKEDGLPERRGPFIEQIPSDKGFVKMDKAHKFNKELQSVKTASNGSPPKKPAKQAGRPNGSKDSKKKRNRRFKSKAEVITFADDLQRKLDLIVDREFLGYYKIDNKRQLTSEQKIELETSKLEMMAVLDSLDFENLEDIGKLMEDIDVDSYNHFMNTYAEYSKGSDSIEKLRLIKNMVYSEVYYEN